MKRILLIILITTQIQLFAQKDKLFIKPDIIGYNIPITLTPLKNTWIYLGCHYGKYKNLVDSAYVNNKSEAVFKGANKLPGGIYFVVSPQKSLLFEFLMDDQQRFSIKADTAATDKATVTGSEENKIFQDYTQFLSQKTPVLINLQKQLSVAKSSSDSATLKSKLSIANQELQDYREKIMKDKPTSLLAALFNTMKKPEVPPMPKLANGNVDSLYPYYYMKEHFWDDVDFADDRIVRTPFFEPKLDEYYKYYVDVHADSVINEVNIMLLSARTGKEIFKYLLGKFTDKYINPEYMGQDKVFLFLFNNFFSKGDTTWLNATQKKFIFDRAYSLMANQIGEQGWDIQLKDSLGNNKNLHSFQAKYTFLLFWDPTCGHCKEMIPRIDSFYTAKWKALGLKVFALNIADETFDVWKKYVQEQHLQEWAHVYQPKIIRDEESKKSVPNFRQLYDVSQTPTFYLLDKDKKIIAKKLTLEQFDEVLNAKSKTQ